MTAGRARHRVLGRLGAEFVANVAYADRSTPFASDA